MTVTLVKRPAAEPLPTYYPDAWVEEDARLLAMVRDLDLESIKLYGDNSTFSMRDIVTGGEMERTIEGASTITLTVHDRNRTVVRNRSLINSRFDIKIDHLWFRLVGVRKDGDDLTLTFEDRLVAIMRLYNKFLKVYRDQMTRAEFVLKMLMEITEIDFRFFCPELHTPQPIRGGGASGTKDIGPTSRATPGSGPGGTIGKARVGSAERIAWDGSTGTSFYGGPNDPDDNNRPSSGIPNTVPGIALFGRDVSQMGSNPIYVIIQDTVTKKTLVVVESETGPAQWRIDEGIGLDINYTACRLLGLPDSNSAYPTGRQFRYKVVGKGEAGKTRAMQLVYGKSPKKTNVRAATAEMKYSDATRNTFAVGSAPVATAAASGGSNSETVFCFFASKIGERAAAGFVGNFVQESGVNPGSVGGGLAQWQGNRYSGLVAYANRTGGSPTSIMTACGWVWAELNGGYTGVLAKLKKAKTIVECTDIICWDYESPDPRQANLSRRRSEAQAAYQRYSGKCKGVKGEAGGGGDSTEGGTRTERSLRRYAYTRGQGTQREDTYVAGQRHAAALNWRFFPVGNTLYFISEEDLFKSRTRYTISEEDEAIDTIDFDMRLNKKPKKKRELPKPDDSKNLWIAELNVTCRLDRWQAPPGTCIEVEDLGPANGKWLVHSIRRDLFNRGGGTIVCQKTLKELPEPPAEVVERTITTTPGSTSGTGDASGGGGSGKVVRPWAGSFPVTDQFGAPRDYGGHLGIDIGAPCGTKCIAAFDGEITMATTSGFGTAGGMMHLKNTQGVQLKGGIRPGESIGWGHISRALVRVGQKVKAGQVIAISNGSPCHIHFVKLRVGATTAQGTDNPTFFLKANGFI